MQEIRKPQRGQPVPLGLVVGIPPKLAVSECLGQLKGASSHAVKRRAAPFRWQEGYGALTLCDEILPTVIAYVRNQKQHHAGATLNIRFERATHDDLLWLRASAL
jgi:putative transposase